MRYDHDGAADALYVRFRDERPERQERMTDGTIVDLGPGDVVVGVEVLVPSSEWNSDLVAKRWLNPTEAAFLLSVARTFRLEPRVEGGSGAHQVPTVPARLAA